ncbi:MAG TPA: prolipoprotein diacylglyceryl transferase [Gemmatimonadales bacterium]|jgi:phosphatidylglycerol:prolipoprotein diacylglycerol transferase
MTVYPFVLHLGPLDLTGYGLMMMVAFLMAGWAIQLDLRQRGLDEDYAADIIIAGVIGGLLGAKIWYVLLTGDSAALLRRGGFVWYGGFLGATAGILLNGWRRRVPARFTAELCAAPLALGYALGRVGCFLVNDDYGIPSNLPWAMKFPNGLPSTTVANLEAMHVTFPPNTNPAQLVAVHPTQIYETILMLIVFWWIWRRRDHGHAIGWLFAWYLLLGGAERFLVEFLRAKDDRLLGPLTLAQGTSVLLMVVGAALLYIWRAPAGPQPLPESLRPKQVALRGAT